MSIAEHPSTSAALSDCEWRSPAAQSREWYHQYPFDDITSSSGLWAIPFGPDALEIAEPLSAGLRSLLPEISGLGDLQENWDSYGGRPIEPWCAAYTLQILGYILDATTPIPSIVPTSRGRIQLEWHCGGVDLEIEIERSGRLNVFFEDLETGEEYEKTLIGNLESLAPFLNRIKTTS